MRRRKGRDNVVAETQKEQNRGVLWWAYQLYLHSIKESLAATHAPLWVAFRELLGYIVSKFR
jgi:hypothetical protein